MLKVLVKDEKNRDRERMRSDVMAYPQKNLFLTAQLLFSWVTMMFCQRVRKITLKKTQPNSLNDTYKYVIRIYNLHVFIFKAFRELKG